MQETGLKLPPVLACRIITRCPAAKTNFDDKITANPIVDKDGDSIGKHYDIVAGRVRLHNTAPGSFRRLLRAW
jgi:hypothetical protein